MSQRQTAASSCRGDRTIMVVTIKDSHEVSAPLDQVWDIVPDVDNDPKYWPNLHTVDNISKDGNVIERKVTVETKLLEYLILLIVSLGGFI